MRMVLLGDLHLYRLALVPWDLLSKRVLGQLNLWLNQRRHFDMALIEPTIERIDAIGPDVLLCTGDLTTTATHGEFKLVRDKLGGLFERYDTVMVPGNHDRYTFTAARTKRFEQYFGKYTAPTWPLYRPLGERLHLVGLDATRANVITDRGYLDPVQMMRLGEIVEPMTENDRLIVMCHYPIAMPPGAQAEKVRHALIDAEELAKVLADCAAQVLYLHGHVHEPQCWRYPSGKRLTIINAGAPVMCDAYRPRGQGFWQIDLNGHDEGHLTHHRMDERGDWQADAVGWPLGRGEVSSIV